MNKAEWTQLRELCARARDELIELGMEPVKDNPVGAYDLGAAFANGVLAKQAAVEEHDQG